MRFRILATLATCASLILAAPAMAKDKLLIGASSASSSQYGYFVALSQLINSQVPGVESSVVETGATIDNLRRISRKQIDFGLVTTNVAYEAYNGTADFEGRKVDNRVLFVYLPTPLNVVVRADSGVSSLADLAGKRFNPGLKGSATEKTAEKIFGILGIQPEWVRGSTTDIVNSIKDNRVVGYVKAAVGNKLDGSSLDIATFTPIKVLSLDDEQRKLVAEKAPELPIMEIPAGAADGIPAFNTWSFSLAVCSTPDLPEETAYQIAKAVFEDRSVQVGAFPGMKGLDLMQLTLEQATIPLHPGVVRYMQEQGATVPDRLIAR